MSFLPSDLLFESDFLDFFGLESDSLFFAASRSFLAASS